MTAEQCTRAKEAGLMSVSVFGRRLEPTHDHLRALAGSHRAALAAMSHLVREGVQVSCEHADRPSQSP